MILEWSTIGLTQQCLEQKNEVHAYVYITKGLFLEKNKSDIIIHMEIELKGVQH